MNCLLLLVILFCCGNNGSCSGNCRRENSCRVERNVGNRYDVREERERKVMRRDNDCDCDSASVSYSCPTPPPTSRTQFPYLDVEPRTCGCEEKQNS